ncbi:MULTISPECIES: sorbosone dehydrogenase family protein [unclassified Rathayibacter]|uniref:PQQ-dependent sugar dehydrogenase n=1 Tax=unclassified Rathayibacter TaxID=2609250 RepID=UPI001FB5136B|nr:MULTISPECIES: PQQ-dependent sugar dehydrogenase [unclassified Rathayibacter]MCJ1674604.1 PQQ-dependent sugar dehydrogenase [Rathayibacter sp. VKM Ac-2929]MCJ1684884.1 PQQ-dependent sugar dehydrogenase [Rathayibacter sp. VKM Ac-2928]
MTRTPVRVVLTAAALALGTVLASCTAPSTTPDAPTSATAEPTVAPLSLGEPEVVTNGLEAPWSIVSLRGVPLVSERDTAQVLELGADGSSRVVGGIDGVLARGESGLLGLAVYQDRLYAYSTGRDGNRIQRFEVTGEAGALQLGPAETLLDGLPSASYHDGGRIAFGPDGMLYATVGDAGRSERAQDLDSLGGKILRMTPDGTVPDDNPYPGSLVYSSGHRNPQGIAWAEDGTFFATEFGQDTWDELNIITPGANYGWPTVEGIAEDDRFVDPVQQWGPDEASPSGMAEIGGTLFLANLRGQVLRAVPVDAPSTSTDHAVGEFGRLRDVTVAEDGRLWVATSNTDGRGDPETDDDRILSFSLEND